MAKKVDAELADPYMRDISCQIPQCIASKAAADATWNSIEGAWQANIAGVNALNLVYEDSIDLSGYANQKLTFFPELSLLQESPVDALTGPGAAGILDATVITTAPIDHADLVQLTALGSAPGLTDVFAVDGNLTYEQVLFCRIRVGLVDTATPSAQGFLRDKKTMQLGSMEPTAADKLFVYRVIVAYPLISGVPEFEDLIAPAQRVILRGTMAEEPTIEYMMRLKRSYELANQV